jgi:hypothetical protein
VRLSLLTIKIPIHWVYDVFCICHRCCVLNSITLIVLQLSQLTCSKLSTTGPIVPFVLCTLLTCFEPYGATLVLNLIAGDIHPQPPLLTGVGISADVGGGGGMKSGQRKMAKMCQRNREKRQRKEKIGSNKKK